MSLPPLSPLWYTRKNCSWRLPASTGGTTEREGEGGEGEGELRTFLRMDWAVWMDQEEDGGGVLLKALRVVGP